MWRRWSPQKLSFRKKASVLVVYVKGTSICNVTRKKSTEKKDPSHRTKTAGGKDNASSLAEQRATQNVLPRLFQYKKRWQTMMEKEM